MAVAQATAELLTLKCPQGGQPMHQKEKCAN
jgi:hypothetical protein